MRFPTMTARTTVDRGLFSGEEARARLVEHRATLALLIADTYLAGINAHVQQDAGTGRIRVVIGEWMSGADDE